MCCGRGAGRAALTLLRRRGRRGTCGRQKRALSAAVGALTGTGRDPPPPNQRRPAPRVPPRPALTVLLLPQQLQKSGDGGPRAAPGSPGQLLRAGTPLREAER